jgi:GT2 family glycosyltransferase
LIDISIIIVNLNTNKLLLDCIVSIYDTVPPLRFEIYVVDNASTDGSVEAVKASFPDVVCLKNDRNLGFAKANNIAICRSSGRFVVLLNTDTLLTPSALSLITGYMDLHSDIGICGGQLINADGTLQNSIANIPSLATELLNKSLLRRMFPKSHPGKEHRFDMPTEVESIIGACMVVSRKALDVVGLLDEEYFFFFEETDWCLSMKRNGFKVMFHPDACIYHLQGQTAKKFSSAAKIEYWKSRYIFFRKHSSLLIRACLVSGVLFKLLLSIMFQIPASFASEKHRSRLKINSDILFWHIKGCPDECGLSCRQEGVI